MIKNRKFKNTFLYLSIVLLPFIFLNITIDPTLTIRYIFFTVLVLILIIYSIINYFTHTKSFLRLNFFYFFLFYIIITGISLFYTINFADGLFEWFKFIFVFLFIFYFINTFNNFELLEKELTKSIIIFSCIISVIGLFQFVKIVIHNEVTHQNLYLITSLLAHKNIFSEILFITVPFSIYAVFSFKSFWRILAVITLFFSIFFITILLSRAVWLSVVFGLLLTLIFITILFFKNKKLIFEIIKTRKTKALILIFIASIIFGILIYSKLDTKKTFEKQTNKIVNFNYGSTKDRIQLWEKTFNLLNNKYLLGYGIGSWKIEIIKMNNKNLKSEDNTTFYQRPHNDFLWVLFETGILGLISYLLLFIMAFVFLFRISFKLTDKKSIIFYTMMFYVLSGFLIFSLFSFPKERIEHLLFISYFFIIIISKNQEINKKAFSSELKKSKMLILSSIVILLTLFGVFVGIKRLYSEIHTKKAIEAKQDKEYLSVLNEIEKANSKLYRLDPYSTPLYWYSGLAHYQLNQISEALNDFKKAYKINPYHIYVLNNLGTCYENLKQHDKAVMFYKQAIAISPNFQETLINLSVVYYNINEIQNAYNTITKAEINSGNKHIFLVIMKAYTKIIINEINDKAIAKILSDINSDDKWLYDIYIKSVKNKNTLKKQLLLDAKYVLEEM